MKTVISKENAIALLEQFVVHQTMAIKIMEISDCVSNTFADTPAIARALFNIDLTNATPDEEEEVTAVICDVVEYTNLSQRKKAERIYAKFEILSRIDNLKLI